jgi:uncharacterized SAM-binding protein YcdF (DUF218 family)
VVDLLRFLAHTLVLLPAVLLLLGAGMALSWRHPGRRLWRWWAAVSLLSVWAMSSGLAARLLLLPLEQYHPPLQVTQAQAAGAAAGLDGAGWIVVLGAGGLAHPRTDQISNLSGVSLARLTEAIALHKAANRAKILLCGGNVRGESVESEAARMKRAAQLLGVQAEFLALEDRSENTEAQAANVAAVVGQEKIILVTSASHMRRAVALFKKAGLDPLPAPVDYQMDSRGVSARDLLPSTSNLIKVESALHEYLGLVWGRVRGRL